MSTLGELKAEISDKSGGDFTASQVESQIKSTIKYYQNRRFWFNQESALVTLTPSNPVIPNIPDDFLFEIPRSGFTILYDQEQYPLKKVAPAIYSYMDDESEGRPYLYTYRDGQFLMYYRPDIDYFLAIYYVAKPADLTSDASTNTFTINADRMVVYRTMGDLYTTYRQDETGKAQTYFQLANDEYINLQKRTGKLNSTGYIEVNSIAGDYNFNRNYLI